MLAYADVCTTRLLIAGMSLARILTARIPTADVPSSFSFLFSHIAIQNLDYLISFNIF
jgi:hypothetical protein